MFLSEFAAKISAEDIPKLITELSTDLFLDYLRVASVGQRMPWSSWAQQYALQTAALGPAPILFSKKSYDVVSAAFINAIYAGSIDADDVHVGAMLHPGCIIFSSALAIGHSRKLSGHVLLPAIIAGYETMIRLGLCIQPSHFKRGFQSTSTIGVLGSALTAASLLFNEEPPAKKALKIAQTLGVAASFAGGLVQFFHSGSTVKRLHAAQAASSGVKAALLVHSGFSGPTDIFEGQDGFARAYSDSINLQALEGLGKDYQITEVAIKPHATSARVLSAIEAANTLCLEHAIQSGQIIAITLGIPKVIQGRLTSTSPKDIQSAQMSAPFCVALSIFKSTPSSQLVINVDDVEQGLHHPEVMRLCELVQCQLDPDVEKTSTNESVSAKLTMQLKNGQTLFKQVNAPKGSPSRPYSTLDHQLGAMTELGRRYSKSTTQEMISLVKNFSTLTDIQTLTNLLQ